jgi:hypothetical protein
MSDLTEKFKGLTIGIRKMSPVLVSLLGRDKVYLPF